MTDERNETADQVEADINFDCPLCQKNISIDARGAGLMIACPDCRQEIQVPIPAAEEVVDLVVDGGVLEPRMQELQSSLADADSRRERLIAELESAQQRLTHLEKNVAEQHGRFEQISAELVVIQNSLDRLVSLLQDAGVRDL
ncbi:MAG: hypothetical protein NTV49_09435 [Kiritimatiellaeota bacterium]|nr:hypothetical protein [Kiritimatiellota bacterium]